MVLYPQCPRRGVLSAADHQLRRQLRTLRNHHLLYRHQYRRFFECYGRLRHHRGRRQQFPCLRRRHALPLLQHPFVWRYVPVDRSQRMDRLRGQSCHPPRNRQHGRTLYTGHDQRHRHDRGRLPVCDSQYATPASPDHHLSARVPAQYGDYLCLRRGAIPLEQWKLRLCHHDHGG